MDLGLVTFADLDPGLSPAERMRDLLEEARLADELGLKVFAVGEHHRPDYLVSSPTTALAAIAAVTKQIRLSSAVSVLSSDDPVRVVGGEHTHGAREPDLLRDGGDRGQRSRRRRDEVVGTVMLSDGEHLQAELVRQPGFLQEVAHAFRGTETGVEVGEGD